MAERLHSGLAVMYINIRSTQISFDALNAKGPRDDRTVAVVLEDALTEVSKTAQEAKLMEKEAAEYTADVILTHAMIFTHPD